MTTVLMEEGFKTLFQPLYRLCNLFFGVSKRLLYCQLVWAVGRFNATSGLKMKSCTVQAKNYRKGFLIYLKHN